METKRITTYLNNNFCVLVPVYYEHETAPAWRKYFIGNKEEAEAAFLAAPEYLKATAEENAINKHWRIQEYILLSDHRKTKEAAAIKAQYNF